MEAVFAACAGLDVHKRTVVACRVVGSSRETRTFGTMTGELLKLSDWLAEAGLTHVGIESTGEFWCPVHYILDGSVEVWLLNAQQIKAVPGRKTDVADAEWIAQLMRHGLVRPSFIPPRAPRDLRELTRHRTNFVRERAALIHRVQKVPEGTNITLASVATDVLGLSGRSMLAAIAAGENDAGCLADLARGKLRKKRAELEAALTGRVRPPHRFLLTELLVQIKRVAETIAHFDARIAALCAADEQEDVVQLLDTIPGIGRATAELLVAEVGTDMSRFPTAGHLASWAGMCPGNNESAGKRRSGRTRRGNAWLRAAMVAAAQSAVRRRTTSFAAQYRHGVTAPHWGNRPARADAAVGEAGATLGGHLALSAIPTAIGHWAPPGGAIWDALRRPPHAISVAFPAMLRATKSPRARHSGSVSLPSHLGRTLVTPVPYH